MRLQAAAAILGTLTLLGCSSGGGSQPSTGSPSQQQPARRGALQISVDPNPIVATNRVGDTYDFPFTVRIREVGGANVEIDEVRMQVVAFGALNVYTERFGSEEIARRGFTSSIGANSEIRYSFNPRKEVPDERLFGQVTAELTADGHDDSGNPVRATTSVTLRR